MRVDVVGGGVIGFGTALELAARGHRVRVLEQGDPPHPDAASTDISKLVRMDYADDLFHTELMERAFSGWEAWNLRAGRQLWHRTGIAVIGDVEGDGFEGRSWRTLRARGHHLVRWSDQPVSGWTNVRDGYINPSAGFAESAAVVSALVQWARDAGVEVRRERVEDVERLPADRVVVAAGAWTPRVLPELADRIRPVGQPVFHLRPSDPDAWRSPRFLPFAADIANTGWYGFCLHAGVVKIANHGSGVVTDPDGLRGVGMEWEGRLRAWLALHLPGLQDAPVVGRRLCLYSDSFDGDFWICPHPARPRVVIASGGSGHAFKFAPALGVLAADVVEGAAPHPRLAWRAKGDPRREAARAG